MKTSHNSIRRVLEASNSQELLEGYRDWAREYDNDLGELEYVAPRLTAEALMREVDDTGATILDAGCGTGLVGECLVASGFNNIHALDFSQEMLDVAKEKDIYSQYFRADMNSPLDMPSNSYDAVICVGAFTFGHVHPIALDELIRITRPEGIITFTVRDEAYQQFDYRSHMLRLETSGAWELRELRHENYIVREDSCCKLCTYAVQ